MSFLEFWIHALVSLVPSVAVIGLRLTTGFGIGVGVDVNEESDRSLAKFRECAESLCSVPDGSDSKVF
jgi:hypothetical protein